MNQQVHLEYVLNLEVWMMVVGMMTVVGMMMVAGMSVVNCLKIFVLFFHFASGLKMDVSIQSQVEMMEIGMMMVEILKDVLV